LDLGLAGKRALITGAGRGLGRSIATNLAKEGVKVALVARTRADLEDVLKEIGGQGHYIICTDLMEEDMPKKVVDELHQKFGQIDIIVNNLGGTLDYTDPFCPITAWRQLYRLNLEVAIELNNLLIPHMREQQWGRIIHISSISSLENQGPVPYCSFKAALTAYTRSMGRFVAPFGIIMAAILPGAIYTKGGYWDLLARKNPEHWKKYSTERMAIHRFGEPDEISNVVTFVCSKLASFCVGSVIPVDGGQGRCFF
jgi:3-oxoacyl-[acyl-carrier protein] reductase